MLAERSSYAFLSHSNALSLSPCPTSAEMRLLEAGGLGSRRPLEASRRREVGGSVARGGGQT
jgi:hypothetical protein